jgi:hypothetical protein
MRIASDEGDGILLRDGLKVSTGLSPRGITQTGPGKHQGFKVRVRVRDVQLVARVASPITFCFGYLGRKLLIGRCKKTAKRYLKRV